MTSMQPSAPPPDGTELTAVGTVTHHGRPAAVWFENSPMLALFANRPGQTSRQLSEGAYDLVVKF